MSVFSGRHQFAPEKAKEIAEAMANKDASATNYFELELKDNAVVGWKKSTASHKKNIYQKLIHDADCLEIIRARDSFDASHLDFYKDQVIKANKVNKHALDIMATLIVEIRSLIATEGDKRRYLDYALKREFENEHAADNVAKSILAKPGSLLARLHQKLLNPKELAELFTAKKSAELKEQKITAEYLTRKMHNGRLLARGIEKPSAVIAKSLPVKDEKNREKLPADIETRAQLEVRKALRKLGVPTRTQKINRTEKWGNPLRSTSMLGYGAPTYSNAGYLIALSEAPVDSNPDLQFVQKVDEIDSGTGFAKKETLDLKSTKLTPSVAENKLEELLALQKMGGCTREFNPPYYSKHNEVIFHITRFDAIYFSQDDNLANHMRLDSRYATHPHSPILQAIYLHNAHKIATGIELPIFHYSAEHNFIKEFTIPDEAEIIKMWQEMCVSYIRKKLKSNKFAVLNETSKQLKIGSMYYPGCEYGNSPKFLPADSNYSPELQAKIDSTILDARNIIKRECEENILNKIASGQSVFDAEIVDYLLAEKSLCKNPVIVESFIKHLDGELENSLNQWTPIIFQLANELTLDASTKQKLIKKANDYLNLLIIKPLQEYFDKWGYYKGFGIALEIIKLTQLDVTEFLKQAQENIEIIAKHTDLDSSETVRNFIVYVLQVNKYQVLTDACKEAIKQVVEEYISRSSYHVLQLEDMSWYFDIAPILGYSFSEQCQHVINYIDKIATFSEQGRLRLVNSTLLENEDVFAAFYKKIAYEEGAYSWDCSLDNYERFIYRIDHIAPQAKMTAKLKAMFDAKKAEALNYYLDKLKIVKTFGSEAYPSWLENIPACVTLLSIAGFSLLEQKREVIKLLTITDRFRPIKDYELVFLKGFKNCPLLHNDPEIFKLLLQKITSSDLPTYDAEIEILQAAMPKKLFNDNQLKIIADIRSGLISGLFDAPDRFFYRKSRKRKSGKMAVTPEAIPVLTCQ